MPSTQPNNNKKKKKKTKGKWGGCRRGWPPEVGLATSRVAHGHPATWVGRLGWLHGHPLGWGGLQVTPEGGRMTTPEKS
jgi:hypothetical protein